MDIISFIPEQLFSLIAALYVLGVLLKEIDYVDDELIPFMLLSVSVLSSITLMGLHTESIIQAVLCTGAAIGINQTCKQISKMKG